VRYSLEEGGEEHTLEAKPGDELELLAASQPGYFWPVRSTDMSLLAVRGPSEDRGGQVYAAPSHIGV
jgi:hypothetical protein